VCSSPRASTSRPSVLAFLGSYFTLATVAAFIGEPVTWPSCIARRLPCGTVPCVFHGDRPSDVASKRVDQIVYGAIAGVASYAVFAFSEQCTSSWLECSWQT
jgi:hypothetical protein